MEFDGVAQWGFFKLIFEFLDSEINVFRDNMLHQATVWAAGIGVVLLTLWIFWHGYRIVSGRSRESMMALVVDALRATLIVGAATTMSLAGENLYDLFTNGMPEEIAQVVTGQDKDPVDMIDDGMDKMSLAMAAIEALPVLENENLKADQDKALTYTGIGVAGPAVVGGALLLMYKVAMGLFVGLGPLFILSLLFEQTRSLFSRWLYYGIGTMFSLAVLSFMVTVALKLVGAVAVHMVTEYQTAIELGAMGVDAGSPGVNAAAMKQGGLGLLLSTLLVTIPPIVAQFFQGALGQFSSVSVFSGLNQSGAARGHGGQSQPAGYLPSSPVNGQTPQAQPTTHLPIGQQRTLTHADEMKSASRTPREG